MKFQALAALVIGSVAGMAGNAFAEAEATAVIVDMRAPVMVNQGDSYVAAQPGMRLAAGDQLIAMDGGSALVNFRAGCESTLGANEVLRIGTTGACASSGGAVPVNAQMAPPADASTGGGAATGGTGMSVPGMLFSATVAGLGLYHGFDGDGDDNFDFDSDLPAISQ